MLHNLKIRECFAGPVYSGEKNFEVRYNADRGFQKGDYIRFHVVNDAGCEIPHPLNVELYEITFVLSGWGLKEDHVAFGIKKVYGGENHNENERRTAQRKSGCIGEDQ